MLISVVIVFGFMVVSYAIQYAVGFYMAGKSDSVEKAMIIGSCIVTPLFEEGLKLVGIVSGYSYEVVCIFAFLEAIQFIGRNRSFKCVMARLLAISLHIATMLVMLHIGLFMFPVCVALHGVWNYAFGRKCFKEIAVQFETI